MTELSRETAIQPRPVDPQHVRVVAERYRVRGEARKVSAEDGFAQLRGVNDVELSRLLLDLLAENEKLRAERDHYLKISNVARVTLAGEQRQRLTRAAQQALEILSTRYRAALTNEGKTE